MKIKASTGRGRPSKEKNLFEDCKTLNMVAVAETEVELLSRLYKELNGGDSSELLTYLRSRQECATTNCCQNS